MMDKMKPIEPGCRVIIIPSSHPRYDEKYSWKEGFVDRKYPDPATLRRKTLTDFPVWWEVNFVDDYVCAPTEHLMRIDDPDIQKQIEQEKTVDRPNRMSPA